MHTVQLECAMTCEFIWSYIFELHILVISDMHIVISTILQFYNGMHFMEYEILFKNFVPLEKESRLLFQNHVQPLFVDVLYLSHTHIYIKTYVNKKRNR